MTLLEYRRKHGLSLQQFGDKIGWSKAQLWDVESRNRASAKLALAIERETGGLVDAAFLNPQIAEARKAAA